MNDDSGRTEEVKQGEQDLYASIMEAVQDLHTQQFPMTSVVNVLLNVLDTIAANFSPHMVGPPLVALAEKLARDAVNEDKQTENGKH